MKVGVAGVALTEVVLAAPAAVGRRAGSADPAQALLAVSAGIADRAAASTMDVAVARDAERPRATSTAAAAARDRALALRTLSVARSADAAGGSACGRRLPSEGNALTRSATSGAAGAVAGRGIGDLHRVLASAEHERQKKSPRHHCEHLMRERARTVEALLWPHRVIGPAGLVPSRTRSTRPHCHPRTPHRTRSRPSGSSINSGQNGRGFSRFHHTPFSPGGANR
jgi:hypothetical protein